MLTGVDNSCGYMGTSVQVKTPGRWPDLLRRSLLDCGDRSRVPRRQLCPDRPLTLPRHHARRTRLPHRLVGVTRMKCAGTPSIHGSSPAPVCGARSASVSR